MRTTYLPGDTLYRIAMETGTSLDLKEMLSTAITAFINELDLSGASVLMFKDNLEKKTIYSNLHSEPSGIEHSPVFQNALAELGLRKPGTNWHHLKNILPITGSGSSHGRPHYYAVFQMPHFGLLLLFSARLPFTRNHLDDITPLAERLAMAASACLQRSELEMVSRSMKSINDELNQAMGKMRATEEALTAHRNHLAMILQSLGDGIIVLDHRYTIQLMNVRAMEYLNAFPDTSDKEIQSYLDASGIESSEFIAFLKDESSDQIEFLVSQHHDLSEKRILRIRKHAVRGTYDEAPETILVLQDITREKEVERIKNEFISNLSHELRTPMNAILGITNVTLNRNSENLTDRQKEGLEMVLSSGQRLLVLINDLLDLSKIEAGKMVIEYEPVEMKELVAELDRFTRALLGDKELSFTIALAPEIPAIIETDSHRIIQIITNLLSNAVKYTDSGYISLSIALRENMIEVTCTDTGIGIDRNLLPLIFERFRQADGSTSRKYGGTGLGLALSKELAHLLGGTLYAESTLGEGTRVTFSFPLRIPEEAGDNLSLHHIVEKDSTRHSKDTEYRLLIVDDEESGRDTLTMILEPHYSLIYARDGEQAVEQCTTQNPDLVLMDIMMPRMSGYQAFTKIREKNSTIPIIAVTAKAMKGEKETILAYGFNGYIAKPVDESLLISLIDSQLFPAR